MDVYKVLMQQNRNVRSIYKDKRKWNFLSGNEEYFVGLDNNIFAVRYNVERFVLNKTEYKSIFEDSMISQLILTNYKYLMLVLYSKKLRIKVTNICIGSAYDDFLQNDFLQNDFLQNDIFNDLKEIKGKNDLEKKLDELDKDNIIIMSVTFRSDAGRNQSIKINSNGTMVTFKPSEDEDKLIPKIIEFLFKGTDVI